MHRRDDRVREKAFIMALEADTRYLVRQVVLCDVFSSSTEKSALGVVKLTSLHRGVLSGTVDTGTTGSTDGSPHEITGLSM